MPTASPIISASEGVEVFTSANAATASTPVIATPTPRMAVTIGIPAASSEPNVIARTISATSTPIASVALTWTVVWVSAWPPTCTARSDSPGGCAAFFRSSTVEGSSRSSGTSSCTWARASRPLSLTESRRCSFENGSVTISTWSTFFTFASTSSTWPSYDVIRSPCGATKRTCPDVPASSGKRCSRVSRPSCDSVPGMVMLSCSCPPSPTARVPEATRIAAQSASTVFARRATAWPRRYRCDDIWIR
jgi:hypothetical protein